MKCNCGETMHLAACFDNAQEHDEDHAWNLYSCDCGRIAKEDVWSNKGVLWIGLNGVESETKLETISPEPTRDQMLTALKQIAEHPRRLIDAQAPKDSTKQEHDVYRAYRRTQKIARRILEKTSHETTSPSPTREQLLTALELSELAIQASAFGVISPSHFDHCDLKKRMGMCSCGIHEQQMNAEKALVALRDFMEGAGIRV